MGIRMRNGEKKVLENLKMRLTAEKKGFTRAKALRAINKENCTEERFVKHANKHVKARAAHLAGNSEPSQEAAEE